MKLKIIKDTNPIMRKKSLPVELPLKKEDKELLDSMLEYLIRSQDEEYAAKHNIKAGVGLAAIQVGVLKRVCVVDVGKRHLEFINPKIIKQSGVNRIKQEGCLSVPNVWDIVKRPNKITVEFYDRNGVFHTENFVGYEAKAICHECDHMDGILFIDRVEKKK